MSDVSGRITSRTRVFALLGDPVAHSFSPVIQNAAMRHAGVDGVYVACLCGEDTLAPFLRTLARSGGGNVTLPHKERAASVLDVPSEAVRRTGACNTFWGEGEEVHGDNTDVEGMIRAVRAFLGRSPEGARILLLGAGGAARAALVALIDDGAEEICIHNRSTERARAVARRIGGERARVIQTLEELEGEAFDLVVNATRLGLSTQDPTPVDLESLEAVRGVLDMVYAPGATALVRKAREMGVPASDGREMLVQQGGAAFERWWNRPPSLEAMRAALTSTGASSQRRKSASGASQPARRDSRTRPSRSRAIS